MSASRPPAVRGGVTFNDWAGTRPEHRQQRHPTLQRQQKPATPCAPGVHKQELRTRRVWTSCSAVSIRPTQIWCGAGSEPPAVTVCADNRCRRHWGACPPAATGGPVGAAAARCGRTPTIRGCAGTGARSVTHGQQPGARSHHRKSVAIGSHISCQEAQQGNKAQLFSSKLSLQHSVQKLLNISRGRWLRAGQTF